MSKVLSPEIVDLADKVKTGLKIEDGKFVVDANTYVQTLPADITVEQAKALHKHNANFFPAVTKAAGELAIAHLKSDKKVETISLEMPMLDRDHFDLTFERKRVFPNPQGGESTTTWGNVKASLTTQAARASRGAMTQVREELSAAALAAFGK